MMEVASQQEMFTPPGERLSSIRQQLLNMDKQYRQDEISADKARQGIIQSEDYNAFSNLDDENSTYDILISKSENEGESKVFESNTELEYTNLAFRPDMIELSDTLELAEEIKSAFYCIDGLDDISVDNIFGENSLVGPSQEDEQLIENLLTEAKVSVTVDENDLSVFNSHQPKCTIQDTAKPKSKEWLDRKKQNDRERKNNHNIVERRRRCNINDRIKELATLLPTTVPSYKKIKKGSILTATVEYLKGLQKEQALKEKHDSAEKTFQYVLKRISRIESTMKLLGIIAVTNRYKNYIPKSTCSCQDELDELLETSLRKNIFQTYTDSMQCHSKDCISRVFHTSKTSTQSLKHRRPSNLPDKKMHSFSDPAQSVLDDRYKRKSKEKKSCRGCKSRRVNKTSNNKPDISKTEEYHNQDTNLDFSWHTPDYDASSSLNNFFKSEQINNNNEFPNNNRGSQAETSKASPSLSKLETLLRKSHWS